MARKEGDSIDEGVRLALQAILVSPDFLFHIERDPKTRSRRSSGRAITSSRRACLTSCGPACRMRNCRGSPIRDNLRNPDVLEQQVRRMMADPKASNLVDNFAAQWLQLRNLGRTKPDPAALPHRRR